MSKFVVMGDSAAAGVGDAAFDGIYKGWGHYLFQSIPRLKEYHNLSRPGARVAEMSSIQLEIALDIKPDLVIFICGGNDVLRNNFNPLEMHSQIIKTIKKLEEIECDVFAMNLHQPSRIIPLPKILKKVLDRRVKALNLIYEDLEKNHGLKLLNIQNIEEVYDKQIWHVDRMHPNRIGHQKLATYFGKLLRTSGYRVQPIFIDSPSRSSKLSNWKWMIRKGTPWFVKRSVDLFPVIIFLSICELLGLTEKIAPSFTAADLQLQEYDLIA